MDTQSIVLAVVAFIGFILIFLYYGKKIDEHLKKAHSAADDGDISFTIYQCTGAIIYAMLLVGFILIIAN